MPTLADYIVLRDNEVNLSTTGNASDDLTFHPVREAVVGSNFFPTSPILMFRVKARGGTVRLRIELNNNSLIGDRQIVAETTARSYHEIVNRQYVNPGEDNFLQFTAIDGDANAEVVISDVVFWYQRAE